MPKSDFKVILLCVITNFWHELEQISEICLIKYKDSSNL